MSPVLLQLCYNWHWLYDDESPLPANMLQLHANMCVNFPQSCVSTSRNHVCQLPAIMGVRGDMSADVGIDHDTPVANDEKDILSCIF